MKIILAGKGLEKKQPSPPYIVWMYENIAAGISDVFSKARLKKGDPPETGKAATTKNLVEQYGRKK